MVSLGCNRILVAFLTLPLPLSFVTGKPEIAISARFNHRGRIGGFTGNRIGSSISAVGDTGSVAVTTGKAAEGPRGTSAGRDSTSSEARRGVRVGAKFGQIRTENHRPGRAPAELRTRPAPALASVRASRRRRLQRRARRSRRGPRPDRVWEGHKTTRNPPASRWGLNDG